MFIIDNDNKMKSKIMNDVTDNPNNNSILNCIFHDNQIINWCDDNPLIKFVTREIITFNEADRDYILTHVHTLYLLIGPYDGKKTKYHTFFKGKQALGDLCPTSN